ncbi:MAG: PH domain-containing protein [Syntrophobacterales bacterium]|nr:PH domain-containing protein [Syntrophobacterales bacterium]
MVVGSALEKALFTVFFIGTAYLFWESLWRRVTIDENGLFLRRLLNQKKLPWEAITHVGGLTIKNKSYILLTTAVGFFIISNYYEKFNLLAEDLLSHVETDRVEDAARFLVEEKPVGVAGVALVWVAAVLLTGIIVLKMYPFIL